MKKVQLRFAAFAFAAFLGAAPGAFAFETVDTLPWPSGGRFPAYPLEPVRPWSVWVQGGVMRDDNILRLQSAGQGETVGRVGVGGRYEQRIVGRQRLILDGRVDAYGFYNFDQLNHVAYSGLANWAWEIGNDIAGNILVGRDSRLIDISESQSSRFEMVTETRFAATGGVMVTPSFRVRGGVAGARGERSRRADIDTRGAAYTVGAEYVSPLRNTLGVEYRMSNGDAPVPEQVAPLGTFVNNDFKERELALVALYSPYPSIRSDWRVGHTQRDYTEIPNRDFSGTTYRMHLEWLPGNKTILGFDAYREPRTILDIAASHVLLQGVAFGPSWAVTAKTVLSARVLRERRQFEGDPNIFLAGAPLRDELVYLWRFGVGWEPERHWQVSAALDHGTRESNFFGRDYHFTAVMANLAYRY